MSATDIEKTEPQHVEALGTPAPVRQTKGQRFKRHCARRWWVWLIAVIIFIVVLVIIILFAAVPAIAQKTMDKTRLNIEALIIEDPHPDRFLFGVNSYIDKTSKVAHSADIDPFEVSFTLDGAKEPFMRLPLDGVHGGDRIPVIKDNHTNTITNQQSFGQFAGTLMDKEEFNLKLNGNTKIRLGKLSPKVKYRETVTLKGFNKLNGMVITSYELLQDDENYNLGGKVLIPNPTVFTLEIGDINIGISLDGNKLGDGIIPHLTIVPGMKNLYEFKAKFQPNDVLKLAGRIAAGTAKLVVRASSVKNKDGEDIPWLAGPLGAVDITVPVNTTYLN